MMGIFKELHNFNNIDIQVIPKTSEKYMSIIINRNSISLESLQFYKSLLDSHASNLEDNDLNIYYQNFPLIRKNNKRCISIRMGRFL